MQHSRADRKIQNNIEKAMTGFLKSPVIFTYVNISENEEFYKSFITKKHIIMYRPKRNKYSEFNGETTDTESLKFFIDNTLTGNGKFTTLDSFPSFEYTHEDL